MAKKQKTIYVCQSCGTSTPKWQGKCPGCNEWNTLVEEVPVENLNPRDVQRAGNSRSAITRGSIGPTPGMNQATHISKVQTEEVPRIHTTDDELNRVLGGGIMPGSVVLIAGEPGIGKSTLMLQIALSLQKQRVLYVTGEESAQQIKSRADRLGFKSPECYLLTETNTLNIFAQAEELTPQVLIIDSIQTLFTSRIESAPGSVSQIRECTAELIRYAKEEHVPVFLIGHITKEGSIAGPKVLEHMVDTVLHFEGDRHMSYRILRTNKNRFGSTAELGIYEMREAGLRQVTNPSEILLSQREEDISGVGIGAALEGNRPLLIEVQSLVSPAVYGHPQRSTTGYDAKRLNMLLAVLEKRAGFKLNFSDVFPKHYGRYSGRRPRA